MPPGKSPDSVRLDRVVEQARRDAAAREQDYRARALKLFPWVCTRCARSFTQANLRELTVHHRDHNHDNNPPDGSNWELLCIYCHENEHARERDAAAGGGEENSPVGATYQPFAGLANLLKK